MKKIIKFLATIGVWTLILAFLVNAAEKRREKKNRRKENEEKRRHQPYGPYEAYLKRPLDFALALMVLLFLFPIYIILAVLVKMKLGSPVLFKQKRPGKDGKIFELYKFRTMTDQRDGAGKLLSDEKRLTEFGKRLRSTSLDELPEFFNILKGEMSLVGPRPLLVEYLLRYNTEQIRRHEVLPGLTGLAQVNGRNAISWEEKFRDDVKYVDHITFWMDLKIIFQTIAVVFKRKGINSDMAATMEVFQGMVETTQ